MYKIRKANRIKKQDKRKPMIENGRGLKTVILPLLAKHAKK